MMMTNSNIFVEYSEISIMSYNLSSTAFPFLWAICWHGIISGSSSTCACC